MPIEFDMSRAARSRSELIGLVEAVVAAPSREPETAGLEWKSELNLSEASAQFSAGRQILGFANRHPDRVQGEFGGCAHLLVGAEPQQLLGVQGHDPADIDNWISPYVGADGPEWSHTYVEVDGKAVLVVTVETPRWGDPIHTLRKGYGPAQAGRIFIRRAGKTVEADPSEIRMLEERSKRSKSHISLDVEFKDPRQQLRSYFVRREGMQMWLEEEGRRLFAPLERESEPSLPYSRVASVLSGDRRSRGEYELQVREYLRRAPDRWQALIWEGAVRQNLAPVELVIVNETDRNFERVEVSLRMPAATPPFLDADEPHERIDSPTPPLIWGEETIGASLHNALIEVSPPREAEVRKDGDHYVVVFAPVHVRPRQPHELPALFLAVPDALIGDEIEIGWRATSTSAEGDSSGTLMAAIAGEPVPGPSLISSAVA